MVKKATKQANKKKTTRKEATKTRSSKATSAQKHKVPREKTLSKKAETLLPSTDHAGFWLRFISYIIDAAVLSLIGSGITVLFFIANTASTFNNVIILLVSWFYFAFMESSTYQATLGKLVVGLSVIDLAGRRISFWKASARHFSKFLSAVIFFIGFIMIGFTEKKQGLHDIISGCLVIKKD